MSALVLLPYGLPSEDAERERCLALLLALGADIARMIDCFGGDLERFTAHAARLSVLRSPGQTPPIVVLTRTAPLALTVVACRRTLESAVPALALATWVIWQSAEEDPFFEPAARESGVLTGSLDVAPIWASNARSAYLVVSRSVRDLSVLPQRIEQLAKITKQLERRPTAPRGIPVPRKGPSS